MKLSEALMKLYILISQETRKRKDITTTT